MASLKVIGWNEKNGAETMAEFPERLQVGDQWIRGRLVAADEALPKWLFDGATEAVRISPTSEAVIERDPRTIVQRHLELASGSAFLVFKSGDVIAARINEVGKDGLKFFAPGLVPTTLAKTQLRGILMPGEPIVQKGFEDSGWRQLHGQKAMLGEAERSEILLEPGQGVAHPAMMQGDGFDFVLKEAKQGEFINGVAALRLTLFARSVEASEKSLRLLVAFVGDEIYCGDEASDGQMRHQGQVMRSGEQVKVQVRVVSDRVLVRVNGTEVVNVPIEQNMRSGMGLILEPGALWGNEAQSIRVAGFEARASKECGRVPQVDDEVKRQVLTIPRVRSGEMPEVILIAPTGDVLRGSMDSWGQTDLELRWGLEVLRVARDRVAAVVLLDKPLVEGEENKGSEVVDVPHWLLMANGGELGMTVTKWGQNEVVGQHPVLGRVVLPTASVQSFWMRKDPPETEAIRAMSNWQIQLAKMPEIEEQSEEQSKQVGEEVKNFVLPLAGGGEFTLEKYRGKVVVLDFWASWCGPCLKALPELMEAVKGFPSDEMHLIGVNQGESAEQVTSFLTTRKWSFSTALDVDQAVSKQFGVVGIPHTVVIGRQGKVALVKTGYDPKAAAEIASKIKELLKE